MCMYLDKKEKHSTTHAHERYSKYQMLWFKLQLHKKHACPLTSTPTMQLLACDKMWLEETAGHCFLV